MNKRFAKTLLPLVTGLLLSLSSVAQDVGASLMGVPIANGTKRQMVQAIKANGGEKVAISTERTQNEFYFPVGTFPGGIRFVNFFYDADDSIILVEARVPPNKAFERKNERDARDKEVYDTLYRRYGRPNRVKDVKNEFGTYEQREWVFKDGSAVVLLDRGPAYGMSLQYINLPLYKNHRSEATSNRTGNL